MPTIKDLIPYFESLVGDKHQNVLTEDQLDITIFENGDGIGYSQFNEILLLLGFDRISEDFFQFLVDGEIEFERDEVLSINSLSDLKKGIERFITLALLFFGNIKFAFKELSIDEDVLYEKIQLSKQVNISEYKLRHNPVVEIDSIPANKTYFLGYLIEDMIEAGLEKDPKDKKLLKIKKDRIPYVKIGERNQIAYLASDNLDVYVATSMRLEHEFIFINQLIQKIFNNSKLKELNLRWFDPTQAYCKDRIDKGLAEALMLKRAKCTLYLAQESDTLGKDSELASTLAQGKPVIAFVPRGDKKYVDELISNLKLFNKDKDERLIILDQIKVFKPNLAWENEKIKEWLLEPSIIDLRIIKEFFYELVKEYYDKRAETLQKKHPLGIQVNLYSGVANGVLVVRTISDCVQLLRAIMLNSLEFDIEKKIINKEEYIYLTEKISQSIFRLKTGDVLLTNSFWNFYI